MPKQVKTRFDVGKAVDPDTSTGATLQQDDPNEYMVAPTPVDHSLAHTIVPSDQEPDNPGVSTQKSPSFYDPGAEHEATEHCIDNSDSVAQRLAEVAQRLAELEKTMADTQQRLMKIETATYL